MCKMRDDPQMDGNEAGCSVGRQDVEEKTRVDQCYIVGSVSRSTGFTGSAGHAITVPWSEAVLKVITQKKK